MLGRGNASFKLKELPSFTQHLLHHHHHHESDHGSDEDEQQRKAGIRRRYARRGYMAIKVGREEQEKIVVPVSYLKHPLFAELLKEAEEEYGFEQEGAIAIPCPLKHFKNVEAIIHREEHHHRLARCFSL